MIQYVRDQNRAIVQLIVSLGLGFEGITLGRKSGALQIAMVNGCASETKTAAFRARVAGDRPEEKLSPLTELLQQKGAGEKK